jgi:hypothetical protein
MELLKIESPFEKESFIKAQMIRWELQWLKNRKQLKFHSIFSPIILAIGLVSRTESEQSNPFIFIGIVFSILTLFLLSIRIFAKYKYKKKVNEIAIQFDSIKMDCAYVFSDESIKYEDKEKLIDFKWSVFKYYSTYKDYLVIAVNDALITSYLFEKKEPEYEKVFEIIKSKLSYKEIK